MSSTISTWKTSRPSPRRVPPSVGWVTEISPSRPPWNPPSMTAIRRHDRRSGDEGDLRGALLCHGRRSARCLVCRQQETYLHVQGEDAHASVCTRSSRRSTTIAPLPTACITALHTDVALSAGVQRMVRSDIAAGGVCSRSIPNPVSATWCSSPAGYGLGETVVQGSVNPDEFYVHKPTLEAGSPGRGAAQLGEQGHPHGVARRRGSPRRHRRSQCGRRS